ncbi:MAG: 2Fe-2S iron-sulfur cluster binding domain-containing protein, partial [Granulosicoccus sp.]|nr:2Fe-2S iron-sulfur cluster binding domain-containing protein [Granulosicoccus sp.]
ERLKRSSALPDLTTIPSQESISFDRPEAPDSIVNAMRDYQAMLDAIRGGFVNKRKSDIPDDPLERANHLKGFGYFNDASMVGIGPLTEACHLSESLINPDIARLAHELRTQQTKTLAAGIDVIMADLKESMDAPVQDIRRGPSQHQHAIVLLYEFPRDPGTGSVGNGEPGIEWLEDAQAARACLLAAENAIILANYIRLLGYDARAHTGASTDINLYAATVLAGLATLEEGRLNNPWLGNRFGVAVVTTELELAHDQPLLPMAQQPRAQTHGLAWKVGAGFAKNAGNFIPFARRRFVDGAHAFEKLKRVDSPTTYIDEKRVARVPKRTDMFARAQFGDMGATVQQGAKNGHYAIKSATSAAERRPLGALVLLQNQQHEPVVAESARDAQRNTDNIKAACYFLGVDAVGISRCPEWAWYSHDATGEPLIPPHDQAISMIIDQGYDTMEGASGDDWISVSQSMRAYLRFSLIGGVIAKQIRNLGYSAKPHTVMDGEVLQPPLLLLSGLGEVSRIGEVILNPYLGPRLKSGVVTTTMPLTHDKPIDFGLQQFCESCNKCARECPSGAITAGPKLMFNGYEIWKSDSQKCATYRITTPGGAMCGRCMKTCPWNLEGIFSEKPFRWAAMNLPATAPMLAKLDDVLDNGGLNPVKKWWWDIELKNDGSYGPASQPVNARDLQKSLDLRYEDQTLAVYPANLAPHPWPFPFPMDREKGIEAYQALITAKQYKARLRLGDTDNLSHEYRIDGNAPVIRVCISRVEKMSDSVTLYEFTSLDESLLPVWEAGAHLDIVIAPGFLRQYSLSGDPADRTRYQIGVLREDEGRGGSTLMHRIFSEGRKIFISKPINHFPLAQEATRHLLMGGGIGVTPMIAFCHELYARQSDFELHYSISTRESAGYLSLLKKVPWAERVTLHVSDEHGRADFEKILQGYQNGHHVYICGPERYMEAVVSAAAAQDYPESARHLEYFSVPELPDYVNHDFTLKLKKTGTSYVIPADKTATDVLTEHGIGIDIKCSDGICGVCKAKLIAGDVEHRDFVLSNAQRKSSIILCQSRAAQAGGTIEVDL